MARTPSSQEKGDWTVKLLRERSSPVTARALRHSTPVSAVVGRCDVDAEELRDLHIDTVAEAGNPAALLDTARVLTSAAYGTA